MCWSSTADLVAGGTVAALGVVALARVRRARELPLAALPLILGAHQLIEALVWWGAEGRLGAGPAAAARTAWALIAYPLLPALVPLAVLLVAMPGLRRRILPFAVIGIATSVLLLVAVLDGPVTASVDGHTLRYGVGVPHSTLVGAGYLLATVGALLASGEHDIRLLGIVCGVGAAVCLTLWQTAFVSTWCALAALSSVFVLRWLWHRSDRGSDSPGRSVPPGGPAPAAF
ncbi:DUF6629 family protein [Streptacidiphilus sp. N1-12]|uniref:DUF6629 family protein n=2 Tax=Streptacidiphilus alkalitolerans TaxID=3342712 RepID=A0ABV6VCC0_9ACTN